MRLKNRPKEVRLPTPVRDPKDQVHQNREAQTLVQIRPKEIPKPIQDSQLNNKH